MGRASRYASQALRTLGQVGEALLLPGAGWRICRLDPHGSAHTVSTPTNAARELRAFARDAPEVAMIVATGSIVMSADGEPALLADATWTESAVSTEGVIPLSMLRNAQRAAHLVLVVAGWAQDGAPRDVAARWLDAVATRRPTDLVVVGADQEALATIETLQTGLAGTAVDAASGTITMRSLGEHLARRVPSLAMAIPSRTATIATPSPLAGPWDPRLTRRSRWPASDSPVGMGSEDLTGTTLPGQFRLEVRLASGGFGTVYRARQLAVARDVAVKVLNSDVDTGAPSGRLFVHEIQSVGRIDHPNVVRIFHADMTSEGRLFYAMELLEGRDLQQLIEAEGRLPTERAITLVRQLLLGLEAAHSADLVHADIKPANVIIVPGRDGERAVLVDFGLARLRRGESSSLSVGGTPAYMAPEQLRNGRVDARSDLFSAALVLVTLLTGWRRRASDELTPPLDELADRSLRETLRRALAIDPAERFQGAKQFAAELAGTPLLSEPARAHSVMGHDRERAYGRTREIDELVDAALYRRAAILAGPPGIGKTALLRGGLIPRLAAVGAHTVYVRCSPGNVPNVARQIDPDASDLYEALARWHARHARKLVLILDQVETMLSRARVASLAELLEPDRWSAAADVTVIACVRDDALPVLEANRLCVSVPIQRLGALDDDGAREAIVLSLQERRIEIAAELVEAVVRDLRTAAAALGGEQRLDGCHPQHVCRVLELLVDQLGPGDARLGLAHYEQVGGSAAIATPPVAVPRARRARIATRATVVLMAVAGVAAMIALQRPAPGSRSDIPTRPAPASSTTVMPNFRDRPTVIVGGSGTLLWGFFAPLASFLEVNGELVIPITSQNDVGSGGALNALRSGIFDVALLSRRAAPDTLADARAAGKILIEVAIGFDETSLFVWHDNPVRTLDVSAVRAQLCCRAGERLPSLTWSAFGVTEVPLAAQSVAWLAFGRKPGTTRETTSATLALADEWLCAPERLCPSRIEGDTQANEVLPILVKDPHALALSSRSFATDQVAAVKLVDRTHGTRLDGRKAFWLYALVDAAAPMPAKLCRFFGVVLDSSVADRLASIGKATGLPDELRAPQRAALGLDDGSCARLRAAELGAGAGFDSTVNRLDSPIAEDVEISNRWVADR